MMNLQTSNTNKNKQSDTTIINNQQSQPQHKAAAVVDTPTTTTTTTTTNSTNGAQPTTGAVHAGVGERVWHELEREARLAESVLTGPTMHELMADIAKVDAFLFTKYPGLRTLLGLYVGHVLR